MAVSATLSLLDAAPAIAQSTPEQAWEPEVAGDIVVTGVRASLQSSAEQKRNAAQVVDVITSEDIGKFPTENVADASQRITGVQITRTRGTGTAASIRGLPTEFTRVQLNGSTLSSAIVDLRGGGAGGDISRSFDFRLLPTEFVSTLEVVKSPTAETLDGGLAGTINVRTVRPLDLGRTTFVGSAFGAWNSNAGKVSPRLSALFSTTALDGRIGFLIAGGYERNQTETHNVNTTGWTRQSEATQRQDLNGDGDRLDTFNIPSQIRTEIAREDRRRAVVTSTIEYRATNTLKFSAEGFYSRFKVNVESLENLAIFTGANGAVLDPSTTRFETIPGIAAGQLAAGIPYATTLGLGGVDSRGNDRINDSVAQTYNGKVGAEFDDGRWQGLTTFTYSKSKQVGDNLNLAQIQRFQYTETCNPGAAICGLALSPDSQARYLDPRQGIVASLNGAFGRETRDEVKELKASLARKFDGSLIRRFAAGLATTWRTTYADATTLVVPAVTLAPLVGLSSTSVQGTGFGIGRFYQVASASRGRFLSTYGGDQVFPTSWLATNTRALLDAVSRDHLASIAGAVQTNPSGIVDVRERILAGYAQIDFSTSDDRLTGNVGLRVASTRETVAGISPGLTGLVVQVETGGTVTVPPAGNIANQNGYTNLLPSANLKFNLTDEIVLRASASRTISRPTLTQLSPSTTVSGGGGNYTITSGNTDLKPFASTNFDATVEWYPNRDTSLTLALFAKDLSTLVRSVTDQVTLPVTFYTASTNTRTVRDQVFQRTRPVNQQGVTLKGLEVGYQQAFAFLPGFFSNTGLQANYTFIANSDPEVLTAASRNNFNVSAFYDDRRLALRASYTWRDKFVSIGLPGGYGGLGVTTLPRANLDVNLTYNITKSISLVLEETNVLDDVDRTRSTLGNLPVDYYDVGQQFLAGVRMRF